MLELYPGPNAGMYGLARIYVKEKKYSDALPYLQELAKANPDDAELKRMLALAQKNSAPK